MHFVISILLGYLGVSYEDNKVLNLDIELARAAKQRCIGCEEKGAALGCYVKACCKTYHLPCANYSAIYLFIRLYHGNPYVSKIIIHLIPFI